MSIALTILCVWIALDLQAFVSNDVSGFWSWLAQTGGQVDPYKATQFIGLAWVLAAFLAVTLVIEGIVLARIRAKINLFAEETLKSLQS